MMDFIPIYKPFLTEENLKYAHDALDSTWISSKGKYLEMTREFLQQILGVKYILLTNNGTTAMHLVAKALKMYNFNIRNIAVPNNVYVAAWNAFLFDPGNFKLYNLDTDLNTWNMDFKMLDEHIYEADALLVVHNLGNVVNVPELIEKYPNLPIIEDACEALGGMYDHQNVGTASLCSAFSFFGNKNFTSGEGGAFVTNNEELYEYAKLLHGQGQSNEKFVHSILGYNYRMTNVEAAILYGQLRDFDHILEIKYTIYKRYKHGLKDVENIEFQVEEKGCLPSYWLFGIRFLGNPNYKQAESFFLKNGIETRPLFYPINQHEYLKAHWRNNDNAKLLSKEVVVFPNYVELIDGDIDYIIEKIKEYVQMVSIL